MAGRLLTVAIVALAALAAPVAARSTIDFGGDSGGEPGGFGRVRMPPYLQCVPYARQVTGVKIFGDARTWWTQADGHYARGHEPRVGAVMAFRPYGPMQLGHVAAVSRIVDSRTVLIRHANWSPINGRRGQIEDNVRAIDVSPDNDWSEVRVWFAPINAMGSTAWPVEGFIYNAAPGAEPLKLARVARTAREKTLLVTQFAARPQPAPRRPGGGNDPIGEIIAAARRR